MDMKAEPETLHDIMRQVRDETKCVRAELVLLNKKKQIAIDNQAKFEKRWGGWKKSAVLFALLTPTLSILTGIATGVIDLNTDWPIILERIGIAAEKVSRLLG